jgi:hypothetical protein
VRWLYATATSGSGTSPAGRSDLATYIGRIVAAGLRPTARVRVQQGRLLAQLADQDAMIGQLSRLGTGDLSAIRRQLNPTGRWVCQRCGRLWQDRRHPGRRWYDLVDDDGPDVCPNCFSYSFTHPM